MRKIGMMGLVLATSMSLGACTSYGRNDVDTGRLARGAAIGAAGGAAVGAVVDGVSPLEGAAAGAVAGAVIGAVTDNDRNWRRDGRGDCYYTRDGRRVYDYDRRC